MSKPERLGLETTDITSENIERIAAMFPNCLTEATNERGRVVKAIDFDMLRQELSHDIVEGPQERYQFNWPEKRKAIRLANAPTDMTLRPCREESVDFDTTQNLYIEGDNLEVLKLLRENYLGKVKMIYIDPPYNTGSDAFVYDDDFHKSTDEFADQSEATDEEGNKMFDLRQNNESNGRFHTDWLNMMYPRLKVAWDLLDRDGVIFVSIDYNENARMRLLLDELFGARNYVGEIYWESKTKSQNTEGAYNKLQPKCEMILVFTKLSMRRFNLLGKGRKEYPLEDEKGIYREYPIEVMNANGVRGRESMIFDISDGVSTIAPPAGKQWQLGQAQVATYQECMDLFIRDGKPIIKMRPEYERTEKTEPFWAFFDKKIGTTESAKKDLTELIGEHCFDTVKPVEMIERLVLHATPKDSIVLDFFSGSATTAHAVMKLNAEDGGKRKFIMVQLPEPCEEKNEAAKAGYKNICEIGKERIRRAGKKIVEENAMTAPNLDIGFRVLKLDSSNMADVRRRPSQFAKEVLQGTLNLVETPQVSQATMDFGEALASNIKPGRTGEDLLFQVMPRFDIPLSAKIAVEEIGGKNVFVVDDGYLMASFDRDLTESALAAIAKRKPAFFAMCDGGFASDNVADNFEQIWREYSPDTVRRVI